MSCVFIITQNVAYPDCLYVTLVRGLPSEINKREPNITIRVVYTFLWILKYDASLGG